MHPAHSWFLMIMRYTNPLNQCQAEHRDTIVMLTVCIVIGSEILVVCVLFGVVSRAR